ncbi:MAG: cytochrome b N-terminal domain-containing protein [Candidatus Nanopelagicaceae bacterium]|nr:cytochrome b N-terminal domain-containing protein [Candidatus Nanopelagicaceae bacterium]
MTELAITLNGPIKNIHFGPFTNSVANIAMYVLVILLFMVPLAFAKIKIRRSVLSNEEFESAEEFDNALIDANLAFIVRYTRIVNSVIMASLILVFGTGILMASRGLSWLYTSNVSRFVHAMHYWSVQIFFVFVILHFAINFWRSAWHGRAFAMWASGIFTFMVCMFTAFTGGLVANTLNSQWLALQTKNVANSLGLGSLFNPLNIGQMLTLHIAIFPIAVGSLVVWHLTIVRGRVPNFDKAERETPKVQS